MPSYQIPPATVTLANGNNASPNITHSLLFTVNSACSLGAIGFYSPAGASGLPDQCVLFQVTGQSQVAGTLVTSPSWSGAAASGWVYEDYASPVALTVGQSYLSAVHVGPSAPDGYGKTTSFWSSGPGSAGYTIGPATAPNYSANNLQGAVQSGNSSITYPTTNESGNYFGVSVVLITPSGTRSALVLASYI